MPNPKISVILPVFNAEDYLELILNSLLNQSEKSIEIIAINDGSTDKSGQILQDISMKDNRLLVINKENGGQSSAQNLGLKHSKGEWIVFADSDDWIHPSAFKTWRNHAEDHNLDILILNGYRFTEHPETEVIATNLLSEGNTWDTIITGEDWFSQSMKANNLRNAAWLKFSNGEFLRKNKFLFMEGIVHADILWTTNLACKAKRVGNCPNPLYAYRRRPNSIITNQSQNGLIHRVESYAKVLNELIQIAAQNKHKPYFRKNLFRLIIREANVCSKLIRKKISSPREKYRLAKKLHNQDLLSSMLQGITNRDELWKVIRFWIFAYLIILSPIK